MRSIVCDDDIGKPQTGQTRGVVWAIKPASLRGSHLADFIKANGIINPHQQAGYMTASHKPLQTKSLQIMPRPYMTTPTMFLNVCFQITFRFSIVKSSYYICYWPLKEKIGNIGGKNTQTNRYN